MTREEALNIWLPAIRSEIDDFSECQALDMAIKALEEEQKCLRAKDETPNPKMEENILTVTFDRGSKDDSGLAVARRCGEKTTILKIELGEQADILYRLLTEQTTKAEIKLIEGENT